MISIPPSELWLQAFYSNLIRKAEDESNETDGGTRAVVEVESVQGAPQLKSSWRFHCLQKNSMIRKRIF